MTVRLTPNTREGDKYNPTHHYIEYGDITTPSAVSGFSIEESVLSKPDSPLFDYAVGFDLSKGNLPSSQANPTRLRETVSSLLKAAGIEEFDIKGSPNNRDFSVRLKAAEPGTLSTIVGALSSSAELEDRSTAYAILSKDDAIRLVDQERHLTGQTDEAYSLYAEELTIPGKKYLTYSSSIPGAAINTLQQNGELVDFEGRGVSAEVTNILFEQGQKSTIIKALRGADIEVANEGNGVLYINAPINEVASALAKHSLIPESANSEIQTRFRDLRAEFFVTAGAGLDRTVHRHVAKPTNPSA